MTKGLQTRQAALNTLARNHYVRDRREEHFQAKSRSLERPLQNRESEHNNRRRNNAQLSLQDIVHKQILEQQYVTLLKTRSTSTSSCSVITVQA